MTDSEKLLILADACSDALLGGERGWERMDIKDFAAECRKAISSQIKSNLFLRRVYFLGLFELNVERIAERGKNGKPPNYSRKVLMADIAWWLRPLCQARLIAI